MFKDIGSLLAYVKTDNNMNKQPKNLIEFIKSIPNIRQLKGKDLCEMLELVKQVTDKTDQNK